MEWIEVNLEVQRVDQEKNWFCGPACAEMILEHFGKKIDQRSAYGEIKDSQSIRVEQLYSTPKRLADYINNNNANTDLVDVVDVSLEDKNKMVDLIFQILLVEKTPVILLALEGFHWVIVEGIRYLDSLDGERTYAGVYIENSWRDSTPSLWVSIDEFLSRWLLPNKFGVTWLNKIVILGVGSRERIKSLRNKVLSSKITRELSLTSEKAEDFNDFLSEFGFKGIKPIQGGGAIVSKPLSVINEDDGSSFTIIPLDAIENPEFGDFIYLVMSGTNKIIEISPLSNQLDIPNDNEALNEAKKTFPNGDIIIDEKVYWSSRIGGVSRLDVYKKATIDGDEYFVFRSGRVQKELKTSNPIGG